MKNWPKVSIVTPTLNAASVLEEELKSIELQDYPKDKIEIIISDGGSTDGTLKISKKYGAKVVKNSLKTAEAGKAVGVKKATGEFIALIDSDNILPDEKWLKQMIRPLLDVKKAVGSEPWSYTWRKEDGFIARYCALIGMNDPFVHFLGNYDRQNLLTGKWTEVPHKEKDHKNYVVCEFDKRGLPTIGANGTVFRTDYLKKTLKGDYLFDIDILAKTIKEEKSVTFVKVKNGIVHTFCESDIKKFARKQKRRVKDFLYHKFSAKDRDFEWEGGESKGVVALFVNALQSNIGMFRFLINCVLVFPLFFQTIKGFLKKPDLAWLFHPLACEITLWQYGWGTVFGIFKKEEVSRVGWKQ